MSSIKPEDPVPLAHPAPTTPIPTTTTEVYFSYGIGRITYTSIVSQQNPCIRTLRQKGIINWYWSSAATALLGWKNTSGGIQHTQSATYPYPRAFKRAIFPGYPSPGRDEDGNFEGHSTQNQGLTRPVELEEFQRILRKKKKTPINVSTPIFGVSRTSATEVETRIQPTYVALGIFPRGTLNPKERIVFIDRPEHFFSKLRWTVFRLRGARGMFLSLKHLTAFRLYKCNVDTGTHSHVCLDAESTEVLYLLFSTYRSWHIPEHVSEAWADWIHHTLNNGQVDVLKGGYSLELVLDWSITRISIVVLVPILLSLAIGLWLNSKAWTDLATIQTAWGTASYIVTAGALLAAMLGFLDIADK